MALYILKKIFLLPHAKNKDYLKKFKGSKKFDIIIPTTEAEISFIANNKKNIKILF